MLALVLLLVLPLQGFTASRMLFIGLALHAEAADRTGAMSGDVRSDAAGAKLHLAPTGVGHPHAAAPGDGKTAGQTAAHCQLCWLCTSGFISSSSVVVVQRPVKQTITPTQFLPPPGRTVPVPRKPPRA